MVVAITGASAGIGAALARELSTAGARLALGARRLERLEALNRVFGGQHLCARIDVADPEQCEQFIGMTVERYRRLDTLVCNAGYGFLRPVAQTSAEQMRQVFQTNLFGTADCIRAAVPQMLKQEVRDGWRGHIVIVTSAVARRAIPFFGAYSATKAAQLSLAEALRVELSGQQIAVTSVHPIGTDTEFGTVSASLSEGKRPREIRGERRQTAEAVAATMTRAIERPRPEAWPYEPARWMLSLATLLPRMADRMLIGRRADMSGAAGLSDQSNGK